MPIRGRLLQIGTMAQDFKAAFYPGRGDKSITIHEFDGVVLSAIQGLNEKLEEDKRGTGAKVDTLVSQQAVFR